MKPIGRCRTFLLCKVAPRRGAWIETSAWEWTTDPGESRPAGARGLKHILSFFSLLLIYVAPRRGAWIETCQSISAGNVTPSRPAGARGLKLLLSGINTHYHKVAPRRGAWIETSCPSPGIDDESVAPRRGAWIETSFLTGSGATSRGRAPQGRVD